MFDADGVLFDSTESNTAYYNAIFALMDEPRMNPEEQKAGVFMSAPQVFELRAMGDRAKFDRGTRRWRTLALRHRSGHFGNELVENSTWRTDE